MRNSIGLADLYTLKFVIEQLAEVRDRLREREEGSFDRYRAALIAEGILHIERACLPDREMAALRVEDCPFTACVNTEGWVERRKGLFQLRSASINCFIEGGPRKGWVWMAQRPPALGEREWPSKQGKAMKLEDAKTAAETAFCGIGESHDQGGTERPH